jgi:signal transduction histidine kinase
VTYHIDDVMLWEVLDAVDSLTAPQRAAKRLELNTDGCDRRLVLRADRQKLVQVAMNVVSNATKFTPEAGRITLTTDLSAPGVCALAISDTGIGMTAEQLAIVFEPYVQFDSPLAREHRGTGLGMPISRELARGMGGELTATSEPGVGSTFTLTLPVS